jgi:hypothetical protein
MLYISGIERLMTEKTARPGGDKIENVDDVLSPITFVGCFAAATVGAVVQRYVPCDFCWCD